MQTFHHTDRKKDFNVNSTHSEIRFINLRHLKIKLPFNKTFCSVIPSLNRLISLDAESRINILELVQIMPNLQALSVRCQNIQHHQHKLLETSDDLIKWLQNHSLSRYTCTIIRNTNYPLGIEL
jgi:hypothetical protein